ncbi:MAG: hypothetical protein OHK0029_15420 [Armatimonadaceae bacterium]
MISASLRRTVRTLYGFACGYCGVSETEVGAFLTIDHYISRDAGGSDEVDNLVYACHACNLHKAATGNSQDPAVLHPLRTDMTLHIRSLPDGTLDGITPEGNRHIETLHLNRPPMVERRKLRRLIQALMDQEAQHNKREKEVDARVQSTKRKIRRRKKQ